jgi:uncharacterized protein involved in tellurium resistance
MALYHDDKYLKNKDILYFVIYSLKFMQLKFILIYDFLTYESVNLEINSIKGLSDEYLISHQ